MAKRSMKSCLVDREVRCVTEGVKIGLAGNRMTVLISKTGLPQVNIASLQPLIEKGGLSFFIDG